MQGPRFSARYVEAGGKLSLSVGCNVRARVAAPVTRVDVWRQELVIPSQGLALAGDRRAVIRAQTAVDRERVPRVFVLVCLGRPFGEASAISWVALGLMLNLRPIKFAWRATFIRQWDIFVVRL